MTDPRDRPYVAGLLVLTVATGVVDAVSYLALDQVFTGNMTGNVLFVGFAAGGAGGIPLLNNVVALVAFVLGAALCGVLLRGRADDVRMPRRALGVLTGGAVPVVAGGALWLAVGRLPTPGVLALTAALALVMCAQAVAARGAHVQDVSTVVVTTTLVNLALSSRSRAVPERARPDARGPCSRWARARPSAPSSCGRGPVRPACCWRASS